MTVGKKSIPLLYSHHHQHHAPTLETHHAKILNYPEVPRRAEIIREHLLATGLMQPIVVEMPMSKSEICQTLDTGMVDYLEAISQDMASLTTESLSSFYSLQDTDPAHFYRYPSVFPQRDRIYHGHQSLMGLHGYYCFDKDAPVGKGTWEAALYSATIAHQGAGMILEGHPLVYSLCRPPGHHASRDLMGGYCYFNNAAIAATRLLEKAQSPSLILTIIMATVRRKFSGMTRMCYLHLSMPTPTANTPISQVMPKKQAALLPPIPISISRCTPEQPRPSF